MILPYSDQESIKHQQVVSMFDNIAKTYDLLNHTLSFGVDRIWRRIAINELVVHQPELILDVATGTGDFAIKSLKRLSSAKIIGIDPSEEMLKIARKKISRRGLVNQLQVQKEDAQNLPLHWQDSFDAVTASFGVRNFENLPLGLSNMHKVLKCNGKVMILEFSKPSLFPFKQLYNVYFRYVLPLIGKVISKDNRAYNYLHESVMAFPEGDDFLTLMKATGFKDVKARKLTFGVCSIYTGSK